MIPWRAALITATVTAVVGMVAGLWLASWWRRRKGEPKGMRRTALYVFRDVVGVVVYVGISSDPQLRAEQHAADKWWAGEVASVEAWWMPTRYMALAAEWSAILFLRPRHNRHPSGSCDNWTEKQPPIVPVDVVFPMVAPRITVPRRSRR